MQQVSRTTTPAIASRAAAAMIKFDERSFLKKDPIRRSVLKAGDDSFVGLLNA